MTDNKSRLKLQIVGAFCHRRELVCRAEAGLKHQPATRFLTDDFWELLESYCRQDAAITDFPLNGSVHLPVALTG